MYISMKETFHDEFLQEDFSVDAFLQNYSATYTLEGLRDALSVHLKSLESRMIDIVNSESDTILSLSSSMNGLGERIENLRSSLEQLKEEVGSVLHLIDYYLKSLNSLVDGIQATREEKVKYVHLMQAMKCCEKVKKILESDSYTKPFQSDILLRAVDQYILQETHLSCADSTLLTNIEMTDLSTVKHLVFNHFNDSFLSAFEKKDVKETISCLQIGVLLENQNQVELLIRKKIVAPKLETLINEKLLSSKGLFNLYEQILKFIFNDLKLLLSLTSKDREKDDIIGYNFFINSIWLDIEEKLRLSVSSIFAPGNPTIFQNRFIETVNFIKKLDQFTDSENSILQHESYETHMKRWNLPVYYQICFNDIVLNYETVLVQDNLDKMYVDDDSSAFKLKASVAALKSANRCLESDVFIVHISDKFLTLVFQVLSRYNTWIDEQLAQFTNNVQSATTNIENELITFRNKLKLLINLHCDINLLAIKFQEINLNMLEKDRIDPVRNELIRCSSKLASRQNDVESIISNYISSYSTLALKQVSNIPRLYRKTNRSVPTEAAQYVHQVLLAPEEFIKLYQHMLPAVIFYKIIDNVYEKITNEYVNVVSEILIQVKKTEDSLRRLKKVRQSQTSDIGSVNDDQKIRIQLQLDVNYYCDQVQKNSKNVNLVTLNNLVKEMQ